MLATEFNRVHVKTTVSKCKPKQQTSGEKKDRDTIPLNKHKNSKRRNRAKTVQWER